MHTWKSPDKKKKKNINQIAYILINKRFRIDLLNVKTIYAADIVNDLASLCKQIKVRSKR